MSVLRIYTALAVAAAALALQGAAAIKTRTRGAAVVRGSGSLLEEEPLPERPVGRTGVPKFHKRASPMGPSLWQEGKSKPGSPNVSRWTGRTPWKNEAMEFSRSGWREDLGERLLQAATVPDKVMTSCGGFTELGDWTWCRKAFAVNSSSSEGLVGLSYGIRREDSWSQHMSSDASLRVPTVLYDCYYKGEEGPMGTRHQFGKEYKTDYDVRRTCIAEKNFTKYDNDGRGLVYETIQDGLRGRKPLSTFMKIDVEGSEWVALEQLLDNEEETAKIRSIDMEAHLNMLTEVWQYDDKPHQTGGKSMEELDRKVSIMEKLAKKFVVVGSSIQDSHAKMAASLEKKKAADPNYYAEEPSIYPRQGFFLDQYCISFVNPKLLE